MKFISRAIISLQKSVRPFSSSSSSSSQKLFGDHSNDVVEDSPAYLRSLLRRPPTLKRWTLPQNSCSFIGTVVCPVKRYAVNNPQLKVYTLLKVKSPTRGSDPDSSSSSSFRVLLDLCDRLSEVALRYLKPDDYIYAHGSLQSYEKLDESGKREIFYKVSVTEWNFVRQNNKNQKIGTPESTHEQQIMPPSSATASDHEELSSDNLSDERRQRNRLRMWQEFFANPHEWWDNRGRKRNPRMPDFNHKDKSMKESLWLNPDDPPWIRKQLELYDSKMGRRRHNQSDSFEWKDFV